MQEHITLHTLQLITNWRRVISIHTVDCSGETFLLFQHCMAEFWKFKFDCITESQMSDIAGPGQSSMTLYWVLYTVRQRLDCRPLEDFFSHFHWRFGLQRLDCNYDRILTSIFGTVYMIHVRALTVTIVGHVCLLAFNFKDGQVWLLTISGLSSMGCCLLYMVGFSLSLKYLVLFFV